MQWYYSKNNTQLGPVPQDELMQKVASGEILASDLVWKEGMRDWQAAGEIPGLKALTTQPVTVSEPVSPSVQNPVEQPPVLAQPPPAPFPYDINRPAPTSGLAIASLICGILALVTCFPFFGIPAVICGHMAIHQIATAHQPVPGRGIAIAGLITGYLGLLMIVAFVIILGMGFMSV